MSFINSPYNEFIKENNPYSKDQEDEISCLEKFFSVKNEYAINYYEMLRKTDKGLKAIADIKHNYFYELKEKREKDANKK